MDITPDRSYWLAFVFAAVMELLAAIATIGALFFANRKWISLSKRNNSRFVIIEIKSKMYFFLISYFIDINTQQHVTDKYKFFKK